MAGCALSILSIGHLLWTFCKDKRLNHRPNSLLAWRADELRGRVAEQLPRVGAKSDIRGLARGIAFSIPSEAYA